MASAQPLPVAVCSPHPVVRSGLKALLRRHPDRFRIVPAPAGPDVDEADVVLYDVFSLRNGDAELAGLLGRTHARVLAVSRELRPDLVSRALAAGVDGSISLGVGEEELVEAVESAGAVRPPPQPPTGRSGRVSSSASRRARATCSCCSPRG
jgi:DNA-binding NarL/FixJ family response regulator